MASRKPNASRHSKYPTSERSLQGRQDLLHFADFKNCFVKVKNILKITQLVIEEIQESEPAGVRRVPGAHLADVWFRGREQGVAFAFQKELRIPLKLQPPRPALLLRIRGAQGSTHRGWRGTRAARALHLPEHLSAAPASASGAAPAQTEGPRVVAKASYLRPIPVLNPVLCLEPRSPPSSRSRLLQKPGAAEFRLPAAQPRRRGRRVRETRGAGGGAQGLSMLSARPVEARAPAPHLRALHPPALPAGEGPRCPGAEM
uniref:Uncharacterized protein n=1 Tax=Rangifer tarandus platyrhynchus TaxID=3082113 RepID=A0ACB0EI57_RANTA|nr:unnamed protein product [Rangifer tarandus platyrhynchus]